MNYTTQAMITGIVAVVAALLWLAPSALADVNFSNPIDFPTSQYLSLIHI